MSEEHGFDEWAVLELLGHRRVAGRLTERTVAGARFLQVTVPGDSPVTQLYAPGAVYCITPVTEATARAAASAMAPQQPVHRWELTPADDDPEPWDGDP